VANDIHAASVYRQLMRHHGMAWMTSGAGASLAIGLLAGRAEAGAMNRGLATHEPCETYGIIRAATEWTHGG
jgi:hypothetical protein